MLKYNLYGNTEVWHNLVNESLTNQVAHAYLFAGPVGIGKSITAKEYIKYLIQANNDLANRIDQDNFLDLLCITKQDRNEISIDMIRKAGDFFKQTPAEGTKKFVIIDSADDLNHNAANALLKILEEPTNNTYIFLISHSPNSLLPTIRSRCRIVKFKPLDAKVLKLIANADSATIFEDFIAGSAGKAIICNKMDANGLYAELIELIKDNDIIAFNKFSDKIIKNPITWQLAMNLLEYIIGLCIKLSSLTNFIEFEQKEQLLLISKRKHIEDWFIARDRLLELFEEQDIYNLDKKQTLLIALDLSTNILK